MYVDRDTKMFVKYESSHNHENKPGSVRIKKIFSKQLKRKCKDGLEIPSKIINKKKSKKIPNNINYYLILLI